MAAWQTAVPGIGKYDVPKPDGALTGIILAHFPVPVNTALPYFSALLFLQQNPAAHQRRRKVVNKRRTELKLHKSVRLLLFFETADAKKSNQKKRR